MTCDSPNRSVSGTRQEHGRPGSWICCRHANACGCDHSEIVWDERKPRSRTSMTSRLTPLPYLGPDESQIQQALRIAQCLLAVAWWHTQHGSEGHCYWGQELLGMASATESSVMSRWLTLRLDRGTPCQISGPLSGARSGFWDVVDKPSAPFLTPVDTHDRLDKYPTNKAAALGDMSSVC